MSIRGRKSPKRAGVSTPSVTSIRGIFRQSHSLPSVSNWISNRSFPGCRGTANLLRRLANRRVKIDPVARRAEAPEIQRAKMACKIVNGSLGRSTDCDRIPPGTSMPSTPWGGACFDESRSETRAISVGKVPGTDEVPCSFFSTPSTCCHESGLGGNVGISKRSATRSQSTCPQPAGIRRPATHSNPPVAKAKIAASRDANPKVSIQLVTGSFLSRCDEEVCARHRFPPRSRCVALSRAEPTSEPANHD